MEMKKKHSCETKEQDYLYRIGMFAQMNHTTVKTLRFYEEKGLLYPCKIDEETGYRYYTMSQMETLQRIMALKAAGFRIEDIKSLDNCDNETAFIIQKRKEILGKIAELTLQLSKLEGYLNGENGSLAAPVVIKKLPAVVCATMQRRIESYDCLFELMPEMGALMEEAECKCAVPEYCFTNYLEAGYKEENILVEVCQAVTERKMDCGELIFKEYEEVEVASIFHKGSYADFAKSYSAILKYIQDNGYRISGSIRENYIDGIWNKESEEEWLSEIQIPVAKIK